jgi:hypothetical protein
MTQKHEDKAAIDIDMHKVVIRSWNKTPNSLYRFQ